MPPLNLTPEQEKEWAELQTAEKSGTPVVPSIETKGESDETKTEETKAETAPATETPQPTPDDPLSGLDPKVRDYVVGLQTSNAQLAATNTQMSQRLSKVEGHIGSLKQQLDAAKKARDEGGEAPSDSQIRRAHGDRKKFDALKDEYPEFAEAIEGYLDSALTGLQTATGVKVDVNAIKGTLLTEVSGQLDRKLEEFRVEIVHRGWQKTTTSPEFVGWVQRQPREVQTLYTSSNSEDVIRLLDLYSETRKATETQTARLTSAAALSSSSPGPGRQKGWDDMTQEEQWEFLRLQDQAQAKR